MAAFEIITDDIKNRSFRKIYYICGAENYLKRYYVNELKKAVSGNEASSPDIYVFDGRELSLRDLTDITEGFPIISEKKLIIIKDAQLSSPVVQYIKNSAESIPDDNIIVLYGETESFDERLKDFKELKAAIEKTGLIVKVEALDALTTEKWITQHIRKNGGDIDLGTVKYLMTQAATDLDSLSNEINKLTAYCERRRITAEDIDLLVCKTTEARTFDLTDAVLDGDRAKAAECLQKLADARTNEIMILSAISSTFGNMYKIKVLVSGGMKTDEITKMLDMKDYMLRKHIARLKNVGMKELEKAIDLCAEADIASKSTSADNRALLAVLTAKLIGIKD